MPACGQKEQHAKSLHAGAILINKQLEAVVANFNPDAATDDEKWHCDVNAAAVDTMTQGAIAEKSSVCCSIMQALLKTLRNVLDDVPKVSKGMRDKLKGTENPLVNCVSQVANKKSFRLGQTLSRT